MIKFKAFIFFALLFVVSCKDDLNLSSHKEKRLLSFTESFNTNGSNLPTTKVNYYYSDNGKLSKYIVYRFDSNANDFVDDRRYDFTYQNDQVILISGYDSESGNLLVTYSYSYLQDGSQIKIIENNLQQDLISNLEINYSSDGEQNTAIYTFSNGTGFTYKFALADNNIASDSVVRGTSLCSEGSYSYDENVNPFSTLGYLDFDFVNFSHNNRLYEDVSYLACVFPGLNPEIHIYDYDPDGYPVRVITTYRQSSTIAIRRYEYSY